MFHKPGLLSLIVLAVVLFLSCKTTKLPQDDKTPPTWKWNIVHSTGGAQETFDQGMCNPKCPIVKQLPGETLSIYFAADDPEGIYEISLGSGTADGNAGQFVCQIKGSGAGTELFLSPKEEKSTLNPDSANNVQTHTALNRVVGLNAGVTCPAGAAFKEANLTLVGTAENYHQGKVTSKLTIYSPECKLLCAP